MSEMAEGEETAKDPNTLKILSDHGILHLVISREWDKSFIKKCHVTCVRPYPRRSESSCSNSDRDGSDFIL